MRSAQCCHHTLVEGFPGGAGGGFLVGALFFANIFSSDVAPFEQHPPEQQVSHEHPHSPEPREAEGMCSLRLGSYLSVTFT